MALLERVAALVRANLHDLVDRAENPVKMMKEVVLDMENQLLQVKTQTAIAIADLHLLERRRGENAAQEGEWIRKAEIALGRNEEDLARAALSKSLTSRDTARSFAEQITDGRTQVENLKAALVKLDAKLGEARTEADLLAAKQRRARATSRAADAHPDLATAGANYAERAREKVERELAMGQARTEILAGDGVEQRFATLEREEQIDKLLESLRRKSSAA